jgi:hypothetical protein
MCEIALIIVGIVSAVLGGIFVFSLMLASGRYLPKVKQGNHVYWQDFARRVYKRDQGTVRISPPQMNDAIKATFDELQELRDEQIIELVRRGEGAN